MSLPPATDADLVCCIDLATGEALLPLAEFAPLIDRLVQLEAVNRRLVERLAQISSLAGPL